MSTAGISPWLQLERQTKTPGIGTPSQDLVKSLINIQTRRELKDRMKRQEERQARLDAMDAEDRARKQELEDFQQRAMIAGMQSGLEKRMEKIAEMETADPPLPPPAERVNVTKKVSPDGAVTETVDRPLPVDPELGVPVDVDPEVDRQLHPEMLRNLDLGAQGSALPEGTPEIIPFLAEQMVKKDPMTATLQGEEVELPYREELMRRKYLESLISPQVMSAGKRRAGQAVDPNVPVDEIDVGDKKILIYPGGRREILPVGMKPKAPGSTTVPAMKNYELKDAVPGLGAKGDSVFLTNAEALKYRSSLSSSPTAAMRNKKFEEKDLSGRMGTLIAESKRRLTNLQGINAILSPIDKAVAWESYKNSLGSLGQIFGRQVLRDVRVSEQDRAVYSATIGVTNLPVMLTSPREAWARMVLLEKLTDTYSSKYGDPPEGKLASDYLPVNPSEREAAEAWVQDQLTDLKRQYDESGGGVPESGHITQRPEEGSAIKMVIKDGKLVPAEGQ